MTSEEKKKNLQEQLAAIEAEETAEREAKRQRQAQNMDILLDQHFDALLDLTEHCSVHCSDENPWDGDCSRCVLLGIKKDLDWQGWPANVGVELKVWRT